MGNVIQFPKQTTLFTQAQKQHLASSIADTTDKPELVVERFEAAICTQLVGAAREAAAVAAESLGNRLAKLIFGE
jgi:hypothetical protein